MQSVSSFDTFYIFENLNKNVGFHQRSTKSINDRLEYDTDHYITYWTIDQKIKTHG